MVTPILPQLLLSAAALLAVSGTLSAYYGSDEPFCYGTDGSLATLFAEAEDGEDDQREDTSLVSEPIVEPTLIVSDSSGASTFVEIHILCGAHNQRGPPQA